MEKTKKKKKMEMENTKKRKSRYIKNTPKWTNIMTTYRVAPIIRYIPK